MSKSLVLLGATGFIGSTLISQAASRFKIKAVARTIPAESCNQYSSIKWFSADLMIPGSLDGILNSGDVVINLAYMNNESEDNNLFLLKNIIDSCNNRKIARFIHCSTAVVVGASKEALVNEETPCNPANSYEKVKLNLEKIVASGFLSPIDFCILRPTAVIGVGGKNLARLADNLKNSLPIFNYLRRSLYGARPLHLVPVGDVVGALLHLTIFPLPLGGQKFIVSSDDDPNNNFKAVELLLITAMGLKRPMLPSIPLPGALLSWLLFLRGRSDSNLSRRYDSAKLKSLGFNRLNTLSNCVSLFGESMKIEKDVIDAT